MNELAFDDELRSLALSIDFFENLKTKTITQQFVTKFIEKFKSTFKFIHSKERSKLSTSKEDIQKCFEKKETYHPTVYNLVFLILFRTFCLANSIEENSRLCIAFKPIDFKCDDLISKPKKDKVTFKLKLEMDETEDKEEEKPTKSTAKNKAKGKSKSAKGKSKKDVSDESEDDEEFDEDFSETEEKKPKRGSKKSAKKSKLTAKSTKSKKDADEESIIAKKFQLQKKNLVEIWPEIYLQDKGEWYCVEPINEVYSAIPEELEKKFYVNALYILAFNSIGHLKDLTSKYISNYYYHKFKRLRLEDEWLEKSYSSFRPAEPTKDELEEEDKIKNHHFLDRPMPTSIADYKSHGLYALERHLLKFEVIYPQDAPVMGTVGKEKVYLRENVILTHSRESWKKEARQIRDDEEPLKVI